MNRGLFVSDLDFTLLRSDATLSARTVDVVNRVIESGCWFTYATARSFTSAARVTAGLRLTLPVITYGGALLVDPGTADIIAVHPLPREALTAITSVTAGHHGVEPVLFAMVEGRDRVCWLQGRETPFLRSFLDARRGDPRLLPLGSWAEIADAPAFYASLIGTSEHVAGTQRFLSPHLRSCFTTVGPDRYHPSQTWLEISSRHGTKAAAVDRLSRELEVAEVVVFGDNLNDVPMFRTAERSCAVANAVPEVLALATEVIGSNDDDGVASWLEQHAGAEW